MKSSFPEKKRALSERLRASSGEVRLQKDISHLFRSRYRPPSAKRDSKFSQTEFPDGHFNRLIEHKLAELGGIKSLYSDSYFTAEEFWAAYNKPAYDKLKAKYDPKGRLSDLYRKCVLRQ